jgi:hypothetical protein
MDGVRLSVYINGITSEIHGVEAFHCSRWHIFTLVQPLDVGGKSVSLPVYEGEGLGPI